MYDNLKDKKTANGFSLDFAIRSGVILPHLKTGIVNDGMESLNLYRELYDKILEEYYGTTFKDYISIIDLNDLKNLDLLITNDHLKYIKTTKMIVNRSIIGLSLLPYSNKIDRTILYKLMKRIFINIEDEMEGMYYKYDEIPAELQTELQSKGLLFQEPTTESFLAASGAGRDWPDNRGIFCSNDHQFIVWINYEDHLSFISIEENADFVSTFKRLYDGIKKIENQMGDFDAKFQLDTHYGYINTCISNFGTGLRSSMIVQLPKITEMLTFVQFKELANRFYLEAEEAEVEHSLSEYKKEGKWEISIKQRIGKTEVELVQVLVEGIMKLISIEQKLEERNDIGKELYEFRDIFN